MQRPNAPYSQLPHRNYDSSSDAPASGHVSAPHSASTSGTGKLVISGITRNVHEGHVSFDILLNITCIPDFNYALLNNHYYYSFTYYY